MSTRRQIFVAAALVLLAGGVVAFYAAVWGGGQDASAGMQGHGHGGAAGGEGRRPVHLDEEGARRIGVTYASAEVKPLALAVRAIGIVSYDETRLVNVNPKIEGWVERLYVDFTGAPVRRGEPLLQLYSPRLVSAQEELILARRLLAETDGNPGSRAAASARDLLESARRRLAYWDIPQDQIARIEETGAAVKTLTLRAPASGIVVEKNVFEGGMIVPGMNVYRIADLSTVWVEAEVFEKDLSLVRMGQHARVTFEAYPGETWDGVVTYVYPTVAVETRTGRIRLELQNPNLRLKPGMYADVRLDVTARQRALLVPRSAVLQTGERALVFVRRADGMLEPREVTLGLAAGDVIEIRSGLAAGEVVVSSATFLIDAESNLGAAMAAMPGMEMGGLPAEPAGARGEGAEAHVGHAAPAAGVPAREDTVKPGAPHEGHGAATGAARKPVR